MMRVEVNFRCRKCRVKNSIDVELEGLDWDLDEFFDDVDDPSSVSIQEEWPTECVECGVEHYIWLEHNGFAADLEVEDLSKSDYWVSSVTFDSGLDWLSAIGLSSRLWKEEVYKNYRVSMAEIRKCMKAQGTTHGYSLINRMVFAQIMSSFEAYLGDTLTQQVKGNSEAIRRLVAEDKELSRSRFSLQEVFQNPQLVEETVLTYLANVVYHNLSKVEALYRIALGIDLPINKKERSVLYKAIQHRHDCVHRNGFDRNGVRLQVFNLDYLLNVQKLTESVAQKLESLLND